jgi:hypothetical protein
MELQTGDQVLVNLAPFIGSAAASRESVRCTVLDVAGNQVHVQTDPPYREVALWVAAVWIEDRIKRKPAERRVLAAARPRDADVW